MGRYISTTGTAGTVIKQVNANYTASASERILADSSSASFTITLPASPEANDVIQIIDVEGTFSTNSVDIDPNGNDLKGVTSGNNLTLDIQGSIVTLIYTNLAGIGWIIQV